MAYTYPEPSYPTGNPKVDAWVKAERDLSEAKKIAKRARRALKKSPKE